ncbi:PREDICTED: DNA polymerase alpha subunit B isoform X2 [Papilio xuthus]|uniref:DNA polymerase alpha subunit B n=1 Tax=Papilio xuthus TaxID=66420 RepID=A0AAJ6ZEI7_PAPXU|nr:PREDICTED: DNA polymerase alpha subunit B isoform X2 [Papilio xuthus]
MATEELVTEQFQFLGIDIQKEVLTKCVSLCEEYNVDAETFIEQWMAFSLTHLNGCPPTLENLKLLEKKEFSKATSRPNALANDAASTGSSLTVYGAQVSTHNEVLSDYMTTTPKRVKVETEVITTQELQPATYSPVVGNSAKYTTRTNPGTVVHSFGDDKILQALAKANGPNDLLDLCITQVPNEDGDVYTKAMFGFELLHEKASTFDNHIQYVSQCILKKANLTETTSVRHKSQTEVLVAGRIECDADARLNSKSVILQGTWEASLSQAVTVDMDSLKQYSLFPGQVVVMRGLNPRGDKFIPHEVYCDAAQPIPDPKADMMNTLKGPLSMLVVAGPYTTSDNMSYEPLKDFITYVGNHRPHVVIMTGPFMDCDHTKVKDNTMAETYKSFFDKLMDSLGELTAISPFTKVYIVSSSKDVFHVNMYPTPPYCSRKRHTNVHFLSDPCTLNVNGMVIGVTSTDILMHISQEEISMGMGGDKLARLANHVLTQQTYYPLWPPPPGLCLDAALWAAHAQLPTTPHILVLPSNFRYFIKDVNGCVVVNPEHLTKGTGGGTFSRILITDNGDLPKNIAAQIVRI